MRRRFIALGIVSVLFLWLLCCGCGEDFDTKEDPTLAEVMAIGKGYLREGNGGSAAEAFSAAMRISPDCAEAKYGILIARNQQFTSLLDQLIGFTAGMAYEVPSGDDSELDALVLGETEPIGDYIQDYLEKSADVWYQQNEGIYIELLAEEDPYFEIDGFTMKVEGLIQFDFGGRLDRTDLHYFGVLNSLVSAIVDIALAHDLNYDFLSIVLPELSLDFDNISLDDPDSIAALIDGIDPIFDLLKDLLTYEENPDFLTLKGDAGVARMQSAGVSLGNMFWRLHLMIDSAYAETGAQDVNTVRYIDYDHDNQGDRKTEALFLPGIGTLDARLVSGIDALAVQTAGAFWDATVYDFEPNLVNPFYIAFANELLEALDILPLVIDEELLESLGIDLGALGAWLNIVIEEIPYVLPIHVGPWFADPSSTGLKDLLWNVVQFWDLIAGLLTEPPA